MAVETDRLERRMQVRFSSAMEQQIRDLSRKWGPVVEVSTADVIRLCVERVHQQEFAGKRRRKAAENPR
jgi:hypothetical protein